jgi:transposase
MPDDAPKWLDDRVRELAGTGLGSGAHRCDVAEWFMIGPSSETNLWIVAGITDLRKGPDSLAALVQNQLLESPFSGDLYIFRGRRGDKIKILWYSQDGWCLFYKRLNDSKFSKRLSKAALA